jgi:two-component system, response regulator
MTYAAEILLVEDDDHDLELTLHALRSESMANRIQVARDGEEALKILFEGKTSGERPIYESMRLVLLDLKLPKVNGIEVLRQIKADPQLRQIPVVILTSSREDRDLVESYKLGVNSYVQKPVAFDEFRATIKQLGFYWLLVNEMPGPGGNA